MQRTLANLASNLATSSIPDPDTIIKDRHKLEGVGDRRKERYVWYWVNKYLRPVKWIALGAVGGVVLCSARDGFKTATLKKECFFTKRGEQSFQIVGYAWDQRMKDFNVVYRPLFHEAGCLRGDEPHLLGTCHISYFDEVVKYGDLDLKAKSFVIPGPFTYDPEWKYPTHLHSTTGSTPPEITPSSAPYTVSGFGTSSHVVYKK